MTMTPEAKSQLSTTIRGLRARLLDDLHHAVEGAYRMSVKLKDAGLDEVRRTKRQRLEEWINEQVRIEQSGKKAKDTDEAALKLRFRAEAEKQAASTLLNRLVIVRLMEASGLRSPEVVSKGFESAGYKAFRQLAPALRNDETEGYAFLLQLVFDDLAIDLPGLFGSAGVADLVPVPPATLRHVVEAFDDPALASCWTDDMTLGWVYQYWNDPEREAIDAKLNAGGKVEPHEIASKTQMFTERYMVDWLLHNSLGPLWLAMCRRQGWTADVMAPSGSPLPSGRGAGLEVVGRGAGLEVVGRGAGLEVAGDVATSASGSPLPSGRGAGGEVVGGGATSPPNPLSLKGEGEQERGSSVLDALEARRIEWRAKRDAGSVGLTELMPLGSAIEHRWAYYLPQPIPDDAVTLAPETIRTVKILDPAVGSGHFLVVAFDLLFALYQEEARHRGLSDAPEWQPRAIVENILEKNLHGIDLDPRAVQIAAAALWMKAQQQAKGAHPAAMNLVASSLRLANLPDTDPALVELRKQVEADTGVPAALTDTIVHALRGADHLGSLLRVDQAVDDAIRTWERGSPTGDKPVQGGLFGDTKPQQLRVDTATARQSVLSSLETFLASHTHNDELGLRLRGQQLATGVRFVRLLQEGQYDLVVGNPPYQGTSKMKDASYVAKHYPRGKADLYAAFLERGLQMVRPGGTSSFVTMNGWMFLKQFSVLRQWILSTCDLRTVVDLLWAAFENMRHSTVAMFCIRRASSSQLVVGLVPSPRDERDESNAGLERKRAAVLAHVGRHVFEPAALRVVPEWPLVYWWNDEERGAYGGAPLIGRSCLVTPGVKTGDDVRFSLAPFELTPSSLPTRPEPRADWPFYIKGAGGSEWIEPVSRVLRWRCAGLELGVFGMYCAPGTVRTRDPSIYFRAGIAFAAIGASFSARAHRSPSIIGNMGASVFSDDIAATLCTMNSARARKLLESLNPGIHFEVGDVSRLPLFPIANSTEIYSAICDAFGTHELHREASVEFVQPGPLPWRHAQEWAQLAVDRAEGAPLPVYVEELDAEPVTDHLSFALGVALGRFGENGEGILDPATADLTATLPAGLCFLDGTLDPADLNDSLGHGACGLLRRTWSEKGSAVDAESDLRTWLRLKFFGDVHKGMYENRPIHWPLSSKQKTFVAWVNIHRLNEGTLRVLLADHLEPVRKRLDGELVDLRAARDGADKKAAKAAEKRFAQVQKAREELGLFIADVQACAEKGPPESDAACTKRAKDARYAPDLDDGVMINAAALWPLLESQWKDPKKWWKELANATGKKDYDWSHLAMRYWPARVDAKCQQDPSLGVAHGCFWRYHPARAWAWELRLQDEIGPDFRIEEKPYRGGTVTDDEGDAPHRARHLQDHPQEALDAVEKEVLRRARKHKQPQASITLLEGGLWSSLPAACWALELRMSEKQGVEFMLHAPDEAVARTAWERANPALVQQRHQLVASLQPLKLDLGDDDDDAAGEDTDEGEDE